MLPLLYYQKAIQVILDDTPCRQFMIFSDDIPWCREHIEPLLPGMAISYSEGLNDIEDLCAMASCEYHILANSSYSWWASYIGHSRLAIAPPIWVYYQQVPPERIMTGLFEGRPNTRVLHQDHDAILHGAYLAWLAEQMQPTRLPG
jgi:Glycosyl transferase family 11